MLGQEHVVQALTNALVQQRLHHAYLFTGTRGVGKTTVSRILAKSLNCQGTDGQGGITAEPCGVCQACKDIDAGRFVDYTELDAASNRGVDEIQSLLEQAVYKPVQGRFKVFMIDEVHMLTNTAFNAMLKTLEEPPEYLKFVLATTDPQKVPVTVLSRCLQFNLRPMAPETVFEHLTQVLQQENLPAEPTALKLLARAARGSMRDALSLTDQAIAFGSGQLQEATVRLMLGSVDSSHVMGLIDALERAPAAPSSQIRHWQEPSAEQVGDTHREAARILEAGRRVAASHTNFVFFHAGRPVDQLQKHFMDKGFRVGRAFQPFNDWCRVSIGTPDEMKQFVQLIPGALA
jgi:DNA polymerase-3 subunit gamma/tau